MTDDFRYRGLRDRILVRDRAQRSGDELAAAALYAGHVDFGLRRPCDQRNEMSVSDSLADPISVDDPIKETTVALVEPAAVEAIRRGCAPPKPKVGGGRELHLFDELVIGAFAVLRYEVTIMN